MNLGKLFPYARIVLCISLVVALVVIVFATKETPKSKATALPNGGNTEFSPRHLAAKTNGGSASTTRNLSSDIDSSKSRKLDKEKAVVRELEKGDLYNVYKFLNRYENPNAKTQDGYTLLMSAASYSQMWCMGA